MYQIDIWKPKVITSKHPEIQKRKKPGKLEGNYNDVVIWNNAKFICVTQVWRPMELAPISRIEWCNAWNICSLYLQTKFFLLTFRVLAGVNSSQYSQQHLTETFAITAYSCPISATFKIRSLEAGFYYWYYCCGIVLVWQFFSLVFCLFFSVLAFFCFDQLKKIYKNITVIRFVRNNAI